MNWVDNMTTKEEVLKIIEEEESSYEYGGSESGDGILSNGSVDFDRIKKAIKEMGEKDDS